MLETVIVQSPLAFVLVAVKSHKVTAAIEVIPGLRAHMVPTAPASFGTWAGALLVGNFGDGRINVYDPTSFAFLGQVRGRIGV